MKREQFESLAGSGPARRPSDGGESRQRDALDLSVEESARPGAHQPVFDERLLVGLRETLEAGVPPARLARRLERVIDGKARDCGARADPRLVEGIRATRESGMCDEELADRLGWLIDVITLDLKRGAGC